MYAICNKPEIKTKKNKNMETKNENTEKNYTKEQMYSKYCLRAKASLNEASLANKKKTLSGLLYILWIISVVLTFFVYFWMSGFDFQAFRDLTGGSLGYWTVAGAIILGLIFILIVETRKPDFVKLEKIFEKADQLIENQKNILETTKKELQTLKEL